MEPEESPRLGTAESLSIKARILAVGLLDIAIDLLLPTLVYLALAPTGRSAAVRLSVGGFAVAAKSITGSVHQGPGLEEEVGRDEEGSGSALPAPEVGRAREARGTRGRRAPSSIWLVGLGLAVVAAAVTLVASAAGASDTLAIIAGTVVLGLGAVPVLLRGKRIDGFALLVLAEVAMSVVLVLISTDPRFILVRPAFYTAVAGLYALATCFTAKPFMMQVTRPVAAGGDPLRAAAFDRAWFTSRGFRRAEIGMTAGLGAVLLAEAVLRVVAVYSRPEGAVLDASLVSQVPGLVLFVGYLVIIRVFVVPIASREVDAEMETVA